MSEPNEASNVEAAKNNEPTVTEIAYWFIPLPDPVEVPHGYVARFSERPNMRRLVESESEEGEEGEEGMESRFLDPFHANGVSLLFRQKEKPLADLWDFDLLLETVAEAFPDLPSRNQASADELDEPAPNPPSEHVTIVEIAALLDRDLAEEDRLSDAFDRSLEFVRRVQRAFYAVTEKPIRLAARESLPPILPMGIRRISGDEDSWPKEIALWPINENVGNIARREDLGEQEVSNLNLSIERDQAAFRAYVDFRREASVALSRDGDYRASVLAAATAAEVLLDDLLMHLLWEERLRPEDAAVLFIDPRAGLLVRLRAQYQPRLRGDWDPVGSGPAADWAKHIASVRHRAVHGGYRPTIEEGQEAYGALLRLERHVGDRLAESVRNAKFLRTGWVFCGESGLARRNAVTRRVKDLAHDASEPNWTKTFTRWRGVISNIRGRAAGIGAEPDYRRSDLLIVHYPDGTRTWVVHDPKADMAAWTAESWAVLSGHQADSVRKLIEVVDNQALPGPVSTWIGGVTGLRPIEDWVESYRRLPLYEVLLAGGDIEQPGNPLGAQSGSTS